MKRKSYAGLSSSVYGGWKNRHVVLLWCKIAKKENVVLHSGLLTSYLSLCELQIVCSFVCILFVLRYTKVVYLATKTIQIIKPYTICNSHQFR